MKKEVYKKSIKFNLSQEDYDNFKELSHKTGVLASEAMRRLVKLKLKDAGEKITDEPAQGAAL